jgi:hypothetical protein
MGDAMMTPQTASDAARWYFEQLRRRNAAAGAPPPSAPGARPVAPAPSGAPPSPEAAQAQASLHQGQFDHTDTPSLAAGSTAPAGPKKDEEIPGTKAYDLAQQRAALQAIPDNPPGARQQAMDRMKAQLQAEAQVFSKQKMDAPTGDGKNGTLSPAEAAQQRITNARELMIRMEALGLKPSDVQMDPRMAEAAENQQKMVDGLARQGADLSAEQIKIAQEARAQRELSRQDPSKVSGDDAKKLRDRMQAALGDQKMDAQSVEKRLLLQGFTPDEIADHFTSRDKDADVVKDPNNPNAPKNNTASRGDPLHPELVAGGDKNPDGTTRRPMTPEEADRAVDINQVLDESWHEGAKFGKVIPPQRRGELCLGGLEPEARWRRRCASKYRASSWRRTRDQQGPPPGLRCRSRLHRLALPRSERSHQAGAVRQGQPGLAHGGHRQPGSRQQG